MTVALLAAAVVLSVAVAVVIWTRSTLLRITVDGHSMEPTLGHGRRVLFRRTGPAAVRAGAVVILELPAIGAPDGAPGRWIVKRVAAGPGEPLPPAVAAAPGAPPDGRVPAGHIAVLGDNPDASVDSRHYGPVPLDRVLGVAVGR